MLAGARRRAILVACSLLAGVALGVQAPSVNAEGFDFKGTFGPDGSEASSFNGAGSVAVDQSAGLVYVLDGGRFEDGQPGSLYKFDLEGHPVDFTGSSSNISGNKLTGISIEGAAESNQQVAVDSVTHTVYLTGREGPFGESTAVLAFQASGEPSLFAAGPGAGTNEIVIPETSGTGGVSVAGVAVDSAGNIYVSDSRLGANALYIYTRSGAPLISHVNSVTIAPTNLAVDSNGAIYVTGSGEVTKLVPTGYPISATTTYANGGQLSATNAKSVAVDPATDEVYVSQGSQISVFDSDKTLLGTFGGPGEPGEVGGADASPFGLAVDSAAERVFVAHLTGGVSDTYQVFVFQRNIFVGAPTIESSSARNVTADSAKLQARINPNTKETTYWFEYGLDDCALGSCAKIPLAGGAIGSGHHLVAVAQSLSGLQSQTLYHFRVVARNELGTSFGPDRTFTTQGSGLAFQLGDGRVWEMVSPPDKRAAMLTLPTTGIIQAAEDGNGLAYLSIGSIEPRPDGNRAIELSSILARRDAGGWSSKDITPPHVEATGARSAEYKLMTPTLSRALLEARDDAPLSPLTTERTPYLRENTEPPVYTPLLTSAEGAADVPPGTQFDQSNLDLMGANQALTVVALRSPAPLVAGAANSALYAWRAGQIQAVSEMPGGGVVAGSLGSGLGSVRNAISEDGSRIFWSPGQGYNTNGIFIPALYLRDTVAEESVRLDAVHGGSGAGEPRPAFQAASADGTVVFFTDSRQLTANASPDGRDLYRCEIPVGASLSGCADITDVSAPPAGSGESANVLDQILALSDNGKRAYFVAEGQLDADANREGENALGGEPNLYLWEEGKGTRFVATLSEGDAPNWGLGAAQAVGYAGRISADASPSGRYLAFMSERSLTGYQNREGSSDEAVQEAFRYDAVDDRLICVSCNPSGAGPEAELLPAAVGSAKKMDALSLWAERWVAATLPEPRAEGFGDTLYRPRTVLDNGRVFFNAFDSLVPADSNRQWDVYQYEQAGLGGCTASSDSAAVVPAGAGCVGLASSGTGEGEAAFLDADPTGDNVFFLSPAKLSALDEDDVYDVYDARVGGVAAQRPAQIECQGGACQTPAPAPGASIPASSSFQGEGNVSVGRQCNSIARRAAKLQRQARSLGRQAHRVENPHAALRMRKEAKRLSRNANALAKKAKRCRRINKGTVR